MQTIQFALEPIVELTSGYVLGAEVLARTLADDGTLMCPNNFADNLKRREFREFLLFEAVSRSVALNRKNALNPNFVSININAIELASDRITSQIVSMISQSGFDPRRIRFELTEGPNEVDMIDLKRGASFFKQHNLDLYIDDFGSGHRPFSYLIELPVIGIKLDQYLIRRCMEDRQLRFLIKACAGLAKELRVDIVAEGVENYTDELAILATGIHIGQGYFYGNPYNHI